MKLATTDQAHRTGTCNEDTCQGCKWWRTFEAGLSETEVAGATWLLPGRTANEPRVIDHIAAVLLPSHFTLCTTCHRDLHAPEVTALPGGICADCAEAIA